MQDSSNIVSADDAQKAPPVPVSSRETRKIGYKRLMVLAALTVVLALCFIMPLWDWMGFAVDSEFYSYMPLMPLITGYLIWLRRDKVGANVRPAWGAAAAAAAGGGAILALYFYALQKGWFPGFEDYLAVMMLAFLLLLLALGFAVLGSASMSASAFPLALLLFMIPYPEAVNEGIESFFQHASASTAHGFYSLVGTPCHQEGLTLNLRGSTTFATHEITNLSKLVDRLRNQPDPVSAFLWQRMSRQDQGTVAGYRASAPGSNQVQAVVVQALNKVIGEPSFYSPERFQGLALRSETTGLIQQYPRSHSLALLNRLLLEDAYPHEVSSTYFGLRVAPECSGVHSTQVLLITSLLAGNLFLFSPWRRLTLALFIIPLAVLRNGFRIFVIGELCVHVNHNMIDSWIHHQGGPVFFALSLIPFFLFLIWLRKSESKTQNIVKTEDKT